MLDPNAPPQEQLPPEGADEGFVDQAEPVAGLSAEGAAEIKYFDEDSKNDLAGAEAGGEVGPSVAETEAQDPERDRYITESAVEERAEEKMWADKAQAIEDLLNRALAFAAQPHPTTSEERAAWQAEKDAITELRETIEGDSYELERPFDAVLAGQADHKIGRGVSPREQIEGNIELCREAAEKAGLGVATIEDWAVILYDHPVSEAYREAHKGINFEPWAVAELVEKAHESIEAAQELENALAIAHPFVGINGLGGRYERRVREGGISIESANISGSLEPVTLMLELYGYDTTDSRYRNYEGGNSEAWERYKGLRADPNTTLGQLKEHYVDTFRAAIIEPMRTGAQRSQSILEDIKSGRASQ